MLKSFLYYVGHTFVNIFKKLFRTWVKWIFLAFIAVIVFALIMSTVVTILIPDDETEPDESEVIVEQEEEINPETQIAVVELVTGALVFLYLGVAVAFTSHSCDGMFLMADVNTLFPSPYKPQSVLMFRTAMQIGIPFLLCLYLAGQIPNLVLNVKLGTFEVVSLFVTVFLLALIARITSIFLYILGSKYALVRKVSTYLPFAVAIIAAGGFYAYVQVKFGGQFSVDAVTGYLNSPVSRMIPVWGWLKGMVVFAREGNILAWVCSIVGTLIIGLILSFVTFRIRVDFYEDAIIAAEKRQQAVEKAAANRNSMFLPAKKRKENAEVKELGLKGSGAWTFFSKTLTVRRRNAKLGFINGWMITVTVISTGVAALTRYVAHSQTFLPVLITLGATVFFIIFGNPIGEDSSKPIFFMAPVRRISMVWACVSSKLINTAIDFIPGIVIAEVILLANPLWMLGTMLFLVSLYYFAAISGFFVDMLLPTSLHPSIRLTFQMWLAMSFMLPGIAVIIVLAVLEMMLPGLFIISLYNCVTATIFMLVSPGLYANGRK